MASQKRYQRTSPMEQGLNAGLQVSQALIETGKEYRAWQDYNTEKATTEKKTALFANTAAKYGIGMPAGAPNQAATERGAGEKNAGILSRIGRVFGMGDEAANDSSTGPAASPAAQTAAVPASAIPTPTAAAPAAQAAPTAALGAIPAAQAAPAPAIAPHGMTTPAAPNATAGALPSGAGYEDPNTFTPPATPADAAGALTPEAPTDQPRPATQEEIQAGAPSIMPPRNAPKPTRTDWVGFRTELAGGLIAMGDMEGAKAANELVTAMQHQAFLENAQAGLAMMRLGNNEAAADFFDIAYANMPNGNRLDFEDVNGQMVGYPVDEETGERIEGRQPFVMTLPQVEEAVYQWTDLNKFMVWTNDRINVTSLAERREAQTKLDVFGAERAAIKDESDLQTEALGRDKTRGEIAAQGPEAARAAAEEGRDVTVADQNTTKFFGEQLDNSIKYYQASTDAEDIDFAAALGARRGEFLGVVTRAAQDPRNRGKTAGQIYNDALEAFREDVFTPTATQE
jgi:hypothetical protein